MGKWTSEHYDDVLGSKFKSLVSGSVKRAKLDRAENTISYEAFVEELDSGDSFTTSLIDLLVKEIAERRLRQSADDRQLISDSTSRNLRLLAAPARVYRAPTRPLPPFARGGRAPRRQIHILPDDDDNDDDDGSSSDAMGEFATGPGTWWREAERNPWAPFLTPSLPSPPPQEPQDRHSSAPAPPAPPAPAPSNSVPAPPRSLNSHTRSNSHFVWGSPPSTAATSPSSSSYRPVPPPPPVVSTSTSTSTSATSDRHLQNIFEALSPPSPPTSVSRLASVSSPSSRRDISTAHHTSDSLRLPSTLSPRSRRAARVGEFVEFARRRRAGARDDPILSGPGSSFRASTSTGMGNANSSVNADAISASASADTGAQPRRFFPWMSRDPWNTSPPPTPPLSSAPLRSTSEGGPEARSRPSSEHRRATEVAVSSNVYPTWGEAYWGTSPANGDWGEPADPADIDRRRSWSTGWSPPAIMLSAPANSSSSLSWHNTRRRLREREHRESGAAPWSQLRALSPPGEE